MRPRAEEVIMTTATIVPEKQDCLEWAELEPLLTCADVRRLYRLSVRSIHRLVAAGRLPKPVKVGGVNRWHVAEVRQHLASLTYEKSAALQ
jgi:predicted DNA-binding transcriptional regulator AlpA